MPQNSYGWEVDWLGDDIGYLYGTSYPTWNGNTVLTGHSTNNLGQDGVFADLDQLTYGDTIIITAWGEQYVYSVQKHYQTTANDSSVVASSTENMQTLVPAQVTMRARASMPTAMWWWRCWWRSGKMI